MWSYLILPLCRESERVKGPNGQGNYPAKEPHSVHGYTLIINVLWSIWSICTSRLINSRRLYYVLWSGLSVLKDDSDQREIYSKGYQQNSSAVSIRYTTGSVMKAAVGQQRQLLHLHTFGGLQSAMTKSICALVLVLCCLSGSHADEKLATNNGFVHESSGSATSCKEVSYVFRDRGYRDQTPSSSISGECFQCSINNQFTLLVNEEAHRCYDIIMKRFNVFMISLAVFAHKLGMEGISFSVREAF